LKKLRSHILFLEEKIQLLDEETSILIREKEEEKKEAMLKE
jgi:hypothetical protein